MEKMELETYIVDKGNTSYVKMLAVERVLEQLYNIVADGILGGEALGPGKNFALVQSGLLDRETESETEREGAIGAHFVDGRC